MAEEVTMELEAVEAVYSGDCVVIQSYPPHIHLHIKPRTAEISSQQFVEALISIQAGPQYPEEAPVVNLVECKGLDEQRQKHLICSIQEKANELSSSLMLVALCEESVEKLSDMNHPDGDCPLCLYTLVQKNDHEEILPFMKLMSCFHCFHSECIIRWWNWLQQEKQQSSTVNSRSTTRPMAVRETRKEENGITEDEMGNCPVCRKAFQAKDIEHVLDLVGRSQSCQLDTSVDKANNDQELLHSSSENVRREKFEAILKLQQERSGLIEPKREIVVLPGMYLPQPVTSTSTEENTEPLQEQITPPNGTNSNGSSIRPSTSNHQNSGKRRPRGRHPRQQQGRHWVRKDSSSTSG